MLCECGDHAYANLRHWHVVLVSPEDEALIQGRCTAHPIDAPARVTFYDKSAPRKYQRLHAVILGSPPAGKVTDHINRNVLDNRRSNLRWATVAENNRNRAMRPGFSGRRGVQVGRKLGTWEAFIVVHGRRTYLGRFTSEDDAAAAYRDAASRLHGNFAVRNDREKVRFDLSAHRKSTEQSEKRE